MLTMLQRKEEAQKHGQYAKTSRPKSICIYLLIIHLEISIQNISLVLSCKSHPKCKLKAIEHCIKRTLLKVNNPCTRKYKHRCFPPCRNSTSPRLMFLSLKLDIGGHEPTIMHSAPSWSCNLLLGQFNKRQQRTCKNTQEQKYKGKPKYYSSQTKHNLIIHRFPANT